MSYVWNVFHVYYESYANPTSILTLEHSFTTVQVAREYCKKRGKQYDEYGTVAECESTYDRYDSWLAIIPQCVHTSLERLVIETDKPMAKSPEEPQDGFLSLPGREVAPLPNNGAPVGYKGWKPSFVEA